MAVLVNFSMKSRILFSMVWQDRPTGKRIIWVENLPKPAHPISFDPRAPTVAFKLEGYSLRHMAERLAQESIFVQETAIA